MAESNTLPAPVLPTQPESKWQREYRAFLGMLPELLASDLRGKFVAVHDGRVVASGDDRVRVALDAYAKHGYVPLHVGLVSTEPPTLVRVPTPRVVQGHA
jgi:hypothetical protein